MILVESVLVEGLDGGIEVYGDMVGGGVFFLSLSLSLSLSHPQTAVQLWWKSWLSVPAVLLMFGLLKYTLLTSLLL